MPTLYLDMDGVLADFNGFAQQQLKADKQELAQAQQRGRWTAEDWQILSQIPNLYKKLPKTDIADQLVSTARQFRDQLAWKISILTAVPKNNDIPEAFQDKFEWIQEYYPDLPIRFGPYSQDKQYHAKSGDILVDDRQDNCDQWMAAGGTAIKVDDAKRHLALQELKYILEKKLSLQRLSKL